MSEVPLYPNANYPTHDSPKSNYPKPNYSTRVVWESLTARGEVRWERKDRQPAATLKTCLSVQGSGCKVQGL